METPDFIALLMQPTYSCVSEWRMGLWGRGREGELQGLLLGRAQACRGRSTWEEHPGVRDCKNSMCRSKQYCSTDTPD